MEFIGDPQEEKLRTMQEFLRFWAWSQKERKRTGVNPLYSLMMSVRNAEEELKRIEQKVADKDNLNAAWRGLTLGKPIPMTRIFVAAVWPSACAEKGIKSCSFP